MKRQSVTVIGAGVAGLCCALELSLRGASVDVVERGQALGDADMVLVVLALGVAESEGVVEGV